MRVAAESGSFPAGVVLGAAGAAAGAAVSLLHLDRLPVTLCLLKRTTGLPCATCGSTRALAMLARLDVAGALAMNPLAVLAALVIFVWCAADLLLLGRGRALSLELSARESRALGCLVVGLLMLNWAYVIAAGR